jgi:DsbC/DsbD-like thiol-disulfide interchange protein
MSHRKICLALIVLLPALGISLPAQIQNVVSWTATTTDHNPVKPGAKISLDISAEIQDGWHVYALTQVAGGPTPLRVTLGENPVVRSAGSITAAIPSKQHDASFDLETQTYTHAFAVHVPVQIKADAGGGKQSVPLDVHYQSCSDRTCLPPRTVHLFAAIEVAPK